MRRLKLLTSYAFILLQVAGVIFVGYSVVPETASAYSDFSPSSTLTSYMNSYLPGLIGDTTFATNDPSKNNDLVNTQVESAGSGSGHIFITTGNNTLTYAELYAYFQKNTKNAFTDSGDFDAVLCDLYGCTTGGSASTALGLLNSDYSTYVTDLGNAVYSAASNDGGKIIDSDLAELKSDQSQVSVDLAEVYIDLIAVSHRKADGTSFFTDIPADQTGYSDLGSVPSLDLYNGTGTDAAIYQPQNLETYFNTEASSGALEGVSLSEPTTTVSYDTISHFYSDYASLLNYVNSNTNSVWVDPTAHTPASGLLTAAKTIDSNVSPTVGKNLLQALTTNTTGKDPSCGTSPNIVSDGIQNVINNALCGMVVGVYTFATNLTASAAQLYWGAAGIGPLPTSCPTPAVSTNQFCSWLAAGSGGGIVGPFQTMMVTKGNTYGAAVRAGFYAVLSIVEGFIIFVLIAMALANILQIQMSNYAIKKVMPGLVVGILLALTSYVMMEALLEISAEVSTSFYSIGKTNESSSALSSSINDIESLSGTTSSSSGAPVLYDPSTKFVATNLLGMQAILDVMLLVGSVLMMWLALLFVLRNVVFAFLIPLAPIAFLGLTFEPLKAIWTRWWKTAVGWIFMPVASNFWIFMALTFIKAGTTSAANTTNVIGPLVMFVAAGVFMYGAVKTPFVLAGEMGSIMNRIGKAGNSVTAAGGTLAKNTVGRWAGYAGMAAANNIGIGGITAGSIYRGGKRHFAQNTENYKRSVTRFNDGVVDQSGYGKNKKKSDQESLAKQKRLYEEKLKNYNGLDDAVKKGDLGAKLEKELESQRKGISNTEKRLAGPASLAESFEYWQNKRDLKSTSRVDEDKTQAEKLKGIAEHDLVVTDKDVAYRDRLAEIENIKEASGVLGNISKSRVKQRKFEHTDPTIDELRKQLLLQEGKSEAAETTSESEFIESIRKDKGLVSAMLEKALQPEARTKKEESMLHDRRHELLAEFSLQDRILKEIEQGNLDKAESLAESSPVIQRNAKSLESISIAITRAQSVDGTEDQKKLERSQIALSLKNDFVTNNGTITKETGEALRRRVPIQLGIKVRDDESSQVNSGEWITNLTNEKTNLLRNIILDRVSNLDPTSKESFSRDQLTSVTTMNSLISNGELVGHNAELLANHVQTILEEEEGNITKEQDRALNNLHSTLTELIKSTDRNKARAIGADWQSTSDSQITKTSRSNSSGAIEKFYSKPEVIEVKSTGSTPPPPSAPRFRPPLTRNRGNL